MKISLEGACNARDLGGIETKYGVTAFHRLIRSGELSRLTPSDVETLKSIPLTRIVDLRTTPEIENSPDVKMEGVESVNISVIRATTFGITYEKSSGGDIAKMLEAGFVRMKSRNETYAEHMELLYRKFVSDEHCRNAYGEFLRLLATQPKQGATLWHCTAGKDRVGTCTALLLHCLGASAEQIFDDYILTNKQSEENRNSVLNKVKPFVSAENLDIVRMMLSADKNYIDSFYDQIEKDFGNVDNFVSACGVTENHVEMLRKNYLC